MATVGIKGLITGCCVIRDLSYAGTSGSDVYMI